MSVVDEVKQRIDIVGLIGSSVDLKQSGRYFKANCPFHQEKTPSFFVFPDRQTWKCFGCGAGGDAISFVMKKEALDFSEALQLLADRVGIPRKDILSKTEEKRSGGLYKAISIAAQYYHELLLNSPTASGARRYIEDREIDHQAVLDFQLGYSSGEGLRNYLQNSGFKENELVELGLLKQKENWTYELFRSRLIFPIKDRRGRVVGFGARALDDSQPKYLNSPQSSIFDKSGILYGIDRAQTAIRAEGSVIIVEGYIDVITAHQFGSRNVVASMGTSLTNRQVKLLKDITNRYIFALDADTAGDAATLRGIDIARDTLDRDVLSMPNLLGATSKLKSEIKIMTLPPHKDPDLLIREDIEQWKRCIDEAMPIIDHIISVVSSKYDIRTPTGRSQISDELLPLIAELDNDIEREYYLSKLAGMLQVNERTLIERAASIHRVKKRNVDKRVASTTKYGDPIEEYCLSILIQHPELRENAVALEQDHFERSENREVFAVLDRTSTVDDMLQDINADLRDYVKALAEKEFPPLEGDHWEIALLNCMNRLEERRLRLQEEYISSGIMSAIVDGEELDADDLAALAKRSIDLNTRLVEKMRERTKSSLSDRGYQ